MAASCWGDALKPPQSCKLISLYHISTSRKRPPAGREEEEEEQEEEREETAPEKRLRLAKEYLSLVEEQGLH